MVLIGCESITGVLSFLENNNERIIIINYLLTSITPNVSMNGKFVAMESNSISLIYPSLSVSYTLKTAWNKDHINNQYTRITYLPRIPTRLLTMTLVLKRMFTRSHFLPYWRTVPQWRKRKNKKNRVTHLNHSCNVSFQYSEIRCIECPRSPVSKLYDIRCIYFRHRV